MPFFVGYNILLNNENNTSLRRVRKKVVASVKRRQIQTVSEVAHRSEGNKESMIQRVVRQIKSAGLTDDIVVATGINQKDSIENQLGDSLSVVTEPCRRDTFPAILLACSYLASKGTAMDEPVIVMPCDSYTENAYFGVIGRMGDAVSRGVADLVLMGIEPTYPSAKYGYIVPEKEVGADGVRMVSRFTEKPEVPVAEKLISEGALWNGGVFAFRLGYLMEIAGRILPGWDFARMRESYAELPRSALTMRWSRRPSLWP